MEQSCYRCRQVVEEGIPFCPHCSAPQIRVVIAESAPPSLAFASGAEDQASTALPASQTLAVLAIPVQWSEAFKPCALAALVASLLMALGLDPFVTMLSVGFLAVVFYRQRRLGSTIKPATGARIGAVSGFLGFAITALLMALASTVSDFRMKFREKIMENAQNWAASHSGDAQIRAAFDQLKTPEGFVTALILGSILFLLLSVVLASIGGALAGAIFGRRDRS